MGRNQPVGDAFSAVWTIEHEDMLQRGLLFGQDSTYEGRNWRVLPIGEIRDNLNFG